MCATCGCSELGGGVLVVGSHRHDDGTVHDHSHGDGHVHDHEHVLGNTHGHTHAKDRTQLDMTTSRTIALERAVLAKNDALAVHNRAWFSERGILALNLVSSPGSGKTTLLERTIRDLGDELSIVVIEGDQATENDSARIRAAGARALQVNTGTGCHLEADMVGRALDILAPADASVVMIENVGNLVCPALFDLGERAKVAILSVTEGDDKPAKYPHMFAAADLFVINKIDLLPYVDFDVARCIAHARAVNPNVRAIALSARSGENLGEWYGWVRASRSNPTTQ
jgi:hydrogenase nickel incorporation protein HypB